MENQINAGNQNNRQVGQKLTSQPVQPPEKQKFNFLAISTISLFLILVVLGGLYLYRLNFASLQNKRSVNTAVTKNIERFSISSNSSANKTGWKTYTEKTHGFTIKFPSDWIVNTSKDDYGVQTLTLKGPTKWTNSGGGIQYPELNIGSTFIYSTSGAICANESSCDKIGTLSATINGKEFSTPILRGSSVYQNSKTSFFDFYRLDFFQLNSLISKPTVTAQFGTVEQGQTIADIISTIIPKDADKDVMKECDDCPQFSPPHPDWCKNGTIIAPNKNINREKNCYCYGPPSCNLK